MGIQLRPRCYATCIKVHILSITAEGINASILFTHAKANRLSQQIASAAGSAVELLITGKHYWSFVVKPEQDGDPYSICFAHFSFGIGSGDTLLEAIADAEFVLATGIQLQAYAGEILPKPASKEATKQLAQDVLKDLYLTADACACYALSTRLRARCSVGMYVTYPCEVEDVS